MDLTSLKMFQKLMALTRLKVTRSRCSLSTQHYTAEDPKTDYFFKLPLDFSGSLFLNTPCFLFTPNIHAHTYVHTYFPPVQLCIFIIRCPTLFLASNRLKEILSQKATIPFIPFILMQSFFSEQTSWQKIRTKKESMNFETFGKIQPND